MAKLPPNGSKYWLKLLSWGNINTHLKTKVAACLTRLQPSESYINAPLTSVLHANSLSLSLSLNVGLGTLILLKNIYKYIQPKVVHDRKYIINRDSQG